MTTNILLKQSTESTINTGPGVSNSTPGTIYFKLLHKGHLQIGPSTIPNHPHQHPATSGLNTTPQLPQGELEINRNYNKRWADIWDNIYPLPSTGTQKWDNRRISTNNHENSTESARATHSFVNKPQTLIEVVEHRPGRTKKKSCSSWQILSEHPANRRPHTMSLSFQQIVQHSRKGWQAVMATPSLHTRYQPAVLNPP